MASGVDRTSRALCYSAAALIHLAAERARPARSHLQSRAEGEESRERVNPVAERKRLARVHLSPALGDPFPSPPSPRRPRPGNPPAVTAKTPTRPALATSSSHP